MYMSRRFFLPVAALWLAVILLFPPHAAVADDARAAALYARHCAACHGDQGDGKSRAQFGLNPPPRDFTSAASWFELSRERMLTSVKYGRPGTAMVGWAKRLEDRDIAAVVDYIRSHFMRASRKMTTSSWGSASINSIAAPVTVTGAMAPVGPRTASTHRRGILLPPRPGPNCLASA